MLLIAIVDKINQPDQTSIQKNHVYTPLDGFKQMKVSVPDLSVTKHDIMNVLFAMVFDEIIRSKNVLVQLAEMDDAMPRISGIRKLNGNRCEIFMQTGQNNGMAAISYIVAQLLRKLEKQEEINYTSDVQRILISMIRHANFHASKIMANNSGFIYENHTIILTFESAEEQDAHVDLDDPTTYQFGYVMSPNVRLTHHYTSQKKAVFLQPNQSLKSIWDDIPDDLNELLYNNGEIRHLLNKYGKVLSRPFCCKDGPYDQLVPMGTISSLPGGEVHSGPKSGDARAILFFTGREKTGHKYDSEVQYCCTSLMSDVIMHSWLDLNQVQKSWMLLKWWEEGLSHDQNGILQLVHTHCRSMGQKIKNAATHEDRTKQIEKLAKSTVWKSSSGRQKWFGDADCSVLSSKVCGACCFLVLTSILALPSFAAKHLVFRLSFHQARANKKKKGNYNPQRPVGKRVCIASPVAEKEYAVSPSSTKTVAQRKTTGKNEEPKQLTRKKESGKSRLLIDYAEEESDDDPFHYNDDFNVPLETGNENEETTGKSTTAKNAPLKHTGTNTRTKQARTKHTGTNTINEKTSRKNTTAQNAPPEHPRTNARTKIAAPQNAETNIKAGMEKREPYRSFDDDEGEEEDDLFHDMDD